MEYQTIVGRRIAKSNIQIQLSREYSVSSLVDLSSTIQIPFQLKQTTNLFIQPEIRQRIETLQQAVYRTQSHFQ